jgi:indolepyruvate ferredoxin oxidoreductase
MTDLADRPSGYELDDRFRLEEGRVFCSGVQALARLPFDQLLADLRHGDHTAAFVSGYQGSPLAGYDAEVADAQRVHPDLPVVLRPAVNEELAATAVMGSQLAATLADCRYDGVVGIWYGKAPGLDRASDAIRHATFAGTSHLGGVVALVGDDPLAKSSTLPSSSDATLVDLHIPILYPGDVQEALDLGRHAIALSRASGLWTSLKVVTAVADGTGTVEVHPDRHAPVIPTIEVDGHPFLPHPSGRLLTPYTLDMEREFVHVRTEIARRYGTENRLNSVVVAGPDDWLGIVASGYTYRELREALRLLGLSSDHDLRRAGIRLLRLLMPVPLEAGLVRDFAAGLDEVLVVEEKNPTLEWLVKDALYPLAARPSVVGKRDEAGEWLVPATGTIDADTLVRPLRRRLSRRLADLPPEPPAPRPRIPLQVVRTPYYCSGCPHNASTRVPEGTLVGGGIGCHAMVAIMEPDRVGDIVSLTAMGNEGAQWIGMAPFVERSHSVQNLGDGTFAHSGSLAIRAAVASGVDITYKLLYNHTVAMTGGQDPQGVMTVPDLARSLLLEGVAEVVITTDDTSRYRNVELPAGVRVRPRSELLDVQRHLAQVPGVTVLIHDQECAAEKRRERRRGLRETPAFRVVINERICEGCGDCGDKSNCLSVQPVDTPYGRKTRIHQSSCNFDLSCMEGDCPSFMTVLPARGRRRTQRRAAKQVVSLDDLPPPEPRVPTDRCTLRLSGIGGTGVVTVSQVVGTAALMDGFSVRGLDQTGLSQKAGPVVSDLRLSRGEPADSNRSPEGEVDGYLAFDLLVAASPAHLAGASPHRTVVVGSTTNTPTGSQVVHPDLAPPGIDALTSMLDAQSRAAENYYLDAEALATGLLGSATTSNVLLLGVAVQRGVVPVDPASIERALVLNGVAVDANVAAFRWGRRAAVDPAGVARAAGLRPPDEPPAAETPDQLIDRLTADLRSYQSARYARRFTDIIERVRAAEERVAPGSSALTVTVARQLHKLMAYKDEYEVARLLLAPETREAAEAVAGPGARMRWHLHPPALRALGMKRKLRLGSWSRPMFVMLRAARRLRGTPFDPFGLARVRRVERALVPEYVAAVYRLCGTLTPENLADAVGIAGLPDQVRGYEHLKLERAERYRAELARRLPG